jgi:hypothetical protein
MDHGFMLHPSIDTLPMGYFSAARKTTTANASSSHEAIKAGTIPVAQRAPIGLRMHYHGPLSSSLNTPYSYDALIEVNDILGNQL